MSALRAHPTAGRRAALGLILLIAFVLRIWNLNWDQGTHQHPDERYWSIITSEISGPGAAGYFDSAESSLNPYNLEGRDTWVYGTFPLFATKAAASFLADGPFPAGAIVTAADAVGIDLRTNGVDDFDAGYNANLVGRLLSALIDTGTVLLVYLLGRDLFDRRVGFVAATLLAFTVLHIQYAHFFGAEPWVAFLVTAGVWLSLRLAQGDLRARVAAGTGLLLGLAMASKLIAMVALIVPAIAITIATAPALAAAGRAAWKIYGPHVRSHPGLALAMGLASLTLVVSAYFRFPKLLIAAAVLGIFGVVVTSLTVVRSSEKSRSKAIVLYDQAADPPAIEVRAARTRPNWHVVVWGSFTAIVVLAATALTYRVFQPYTFDGLASIDPRFTRDIDYLTGVNSGGNVPWVVQWIGRTPLLFPLKSVFLWGMGPALSLAVVVGIWKAVSDVVRRQRWVLLLPLGLIAVMIGLVSQQFNPLIRYLQPAYPVAVVLGAFGVVTIWNAGQAAMTTAGTGARGQLRGRALQVAAASMVAFTALWGLAFVNGVYNTDHPRIQASVWMAQNLPPDAVLSNQIWDDSLPLRVPGTETAAFTLVALDPYQPDVAFNGETQLSKTRQLIASLDQVDYVVEASNRLYDSIPRIPAKYPATTAYYQSLFDGRLGFEQIAEFRNSPSLFGIDIPDHFAEETFTVYDHPTVTIWQKTDRFSVARAEALLNPAKASVAPDVPPNQSATNVLLFRPDEIADLATGETFNDVFTTSGPTATLTWVWWLMWLQLAALAVLPWTTLLFKSLPDVGYGLTKILGLLTVGLAVWLTVSWDVAAYGRNITWVWFALVAAFGVVLWGRHSVRMADLFRSHRRSWLASEVVFVGVFALAIWMRSANPDLWEAHLGGEKPMELAYLTAIARAPGFPAPDPWFAGGIMNYYYFGWYLLTVPMRALRVPPGIAFNLGVATYAAMTASVTFSIVHNLVATSRSRWAVRRKAATVERGSWAPVTTGLVGVVLLLGIGNLDAIRLHYARLRVVNRWDLATDVPVLGHIITFAGGTWAWANGATLGRFDWWQPSRVNRGNFDITEFPYFTFLFGDLHPHLMGMVFIGLVVSMALAYLLSSRSGDKREPLLLAVALGVVTGVVRAVNTWDLPSVAIVAAFAIVIGRSLAPVDNIGDDPARRGRAVLLAVGGLACGLSYFGGPGNVVLLGLGAIGGVSLLAVVVKPALRLRLLSIIGHASVVAAAHLIVFWPFIRNTETFDTGLQRAVEGSPLDDFVVHWGIFFTLAVALGIALMVDAHRRARAGEPGPGPLPAFMWGNRLLKTGWVMVAAGVVLATATISTGAAAISVAGFVVFGALWLTEVRRDEPDMGRLVAVGMFTLGFAISGGVDVVTVQNDIERMNTVFKFWLQAWQYFAFGAAFAVWQVGRVVAERPTKVHGPGAPATIEIHQDRPWRAGVWLGMVAIILLAGLSYPILATRTRLETRFADLPATLDGLAYLESDPIIVRIDGDRGEVTVRIADDLPLIKWLHENARGTPALVEWAGSPYDWNARMAVYTGLPTVLGWDWHQRQQRWAFQTMIDQRLEAIRRLYTVDDPSGVTRFLQAYGVTYVVVGTQEHRFGTPEALAGLAQHPALRPVFTSGQNVIYEVDRTILWPALDPNELNLVAAS